ncbi:MAG: hypothetical protein IT458_19540 [Planctomycetes bacterium]|nr:hypothetical protein [Planctomycetota bacterium]
MTESPSPRASAPLLLAIALVSAATLGVQVLQTRLFSVLLWHHLTYMVVTITLLGFAAGGTLLALAPRLGRFGGDPRVAVSLCCSLFGLTLVGAFSLLSHTSLDTLDIERDRTKYFTLFLSYAYLVVPFLFAGGAVAIALHEFGASVHRTYFWNLLGSSLGGFVFVAVMRPLGGAGTLYLFATLSGAAALLALHGMRAAPARILGWSAFVILPLNWLAPGWTAHVIHVEPARSKAQFTSQNYLYPKLAELARRQDPAYQGTDPRLERTIWSPHCRIDTVPMPPPVADAKRDREDPAGGPRGQVHVFQDGDAPTVIWGKGHARERDYDRHFYGLGYRLVQQPRVLVIGPGGGNDVETALHYGASAVTAVDINGDTLNLVMEQFRDYSGDVYRKPGVTPVHSEGRSFLRRAGGTYDLVQMSGTDTYAALSSGSYIFSESYLYTEEAFDDYFAHLSERGVLCIIRFNFAPPRETVKLVATGARALRRLGVADPSRHVLVVHQEDRQIPAFVEALVALEGKAVPPEVVEFGREPLRYSFTIFRRAPFTDADVATIRAAIAPMDQPPLVRHELYYAAGHGDLPTNEYARLLQASAAGPEAERRFHESYAFNTTPARDDRPFFFHLHSWRDLFASERRGESGYAGLAGKEPIGIYILASLLLQTVVVTLVLVVLPLFRLGFRLRGGDNSRGRVITYFAALGLAYMLVEISTIQRFVLYLGHPTWSLTTGLAGFLLFSGLGSAYAGRVQAGPRFARGAAVAVVVLLVLQSAALPWFLHATLALQEWQRVALTIACIAPVAFVMGMPFPTGLRALHGESQSVVAWAFGVNGAASVLASILSIVLAMELGFTAVFLAAAALYLVAACTVPHTAGSPHRPAEVRVGG